jgi:hypothetical protein
MNTQSRTKSCVNIADKDPDTKDNKWKCETCGKMIAPKKFRTHIGAHIIMEQLSSAVCGYCGGIGCDSWIQRTSGSGVHKTLGPGSNCLKFYKFSLASAMKSTRTGPCTNRPFSCNIGDCRSVFLWTYNAEDHHRLHHTNVAVYDEYIITEEEKILIKKILK